MPAQTTARRSGDPICALDKPFIWDKLMYNKNHLHVGIMRMDALHQHLMTISLEQ
jgi:hypothetical protein